eukprot:s2847_g2.t1
MTQWCAFASQILRGQKASLALCCWTVGIACLVAWFMRSHRQRGCSSQPTKAGKAFPAGNQHTHWTRSIPGRYDLLTWGMAVLSAVFSASTNRIDFLLVVNLFTCVFACQAQQALAKRRCRTGWIKKARTVGRARWRTRRRQRLPLCRTQVLLAVLLLVAPGTLLCVHAVGSGNKPKPNNMWCMGRKLRNQLMRAMHGNTMDRAKKTTADRASVEDRSLSSSCPTTTAESSNPTPWKKQKSEVEAHVPQPAGPSPKPGTANNKPTEEAIDLDLLAQARIGSNVIIVPGDGWCFFHAVRRHCRSWKTWSVPQAAELYVEALEWLCSQKDGPNADAVEMACAPFDERELRLHKQYLMRARKADLIAEHMTESEIVILSKLVAVLQKPRMLDSIHHGSFAELWALAEAFDFQCLIWSYDVWQQNFWVRGQTYIDDEEAHARLRDHPQVNLENVGNMGITGHYDIVERSASLRPPFPDTAWTLAWKRAGANAVLQRAAAIFQAPLPPLPPPCEPPPIPTQWHR